METGGQLPAPQRAPASGDAAGRPGGRAAAQGFSAFHRWPRSPADPLAGSPGIRNRGDRDR